jgi:ABC-type multidrug transport system fused ATPase/permease subunit
MNHIKQKYFLLLKKLWDHIEKKRRVQFFLLFILMTFASFAEIFSISATIPFLSVLTSPEKVFYHKLAKPLILYFKIKNPNDLLLPLTLIFIFGAIFSGLMRVVLLWFQIKLSQFVGSDISNNIYKRTLYQPYSVHISRNSSEIIDGVRTKSNSVVGTTLMPVLTILSSLMMLIAIITTIIFINPIVAVSAIVCFGAFYFLLIKITKSILIQNSYIVSQVSIKILKNLQEGLGGIRDVLIDGSQEIYCEIYRKSDLEYRNSESKIGFISNGPKFIAEAFGMIIMALLAYKISESSSNFESVLPLLGVLALGAQRILPLLQQIYSSWSTMRGGQSNLHDALCLLEQPLPKINSQIKKLDFKNFITFNKVSFSYYKELKNILDEITFTINKGNRIGFIGATGTGKTTILDLIMGLLKPTSGEIIVDNVIINEFNQSSWQSNIAHVPQNIFLSDSTILENIAFGVPADEIDIQKVIECAKKAQLNSSINAWDNKYNTMVGERGIRLSGGQRQRIGIARALYKNASVIVFDEATSALDTFTENEVMSEIDNLDKKLTIIIVAHRLTTLKSCDIIYEIENGKIKREGKYKQIIEN